MYSFVVDIQLKHLAMLVPAKNKSTRLWLQIFYIFLILSSKLKALVSLFQHMTAATKGHTLPALPRHTSMYSVTAFFPSA